MLVKEIINRLKAKRPVCLMARMSLARLLSPDAIDQLFYDQANEQYERKIPFSALTELMADVTLCLSRSVNAGYKKLCEQLKAGRSSVFNKLARVEPQVAQALVRYSYQQTRQICNQMHAWSGSDVAGYRTKILDGNADGGGRTAARKIAGSARPPVPRNSGHVPDRRWARARANRPG
jgi:hypothetical protein